MRAAGGALALLLLCGVGAQAPQDPQPCEDDCLTEALASDPTKGCPAGSYWLPYPATNPVGGCRPCSEGFFCPGVAYGDFPERPVNLNRRVACPKGTFRNVTGASRLDQCTKCPAGYFQDWHGQTACVGCPAGKHVTQSGSTSVYDCVKCPCGNYCPLASPAPIQCPAGTYTRNEQMRELPNCAICPPGSACPEGACDPVGCLECPPGKFGNVSGIKALATDAEQCNFTSDACTTCPGSFFCPAGSAVPTSCPPGTTSGPGVSDEASCMDCPVGFRCQLPANASTLQSLVVREANGEQVVGSVQPEACTVDETVIHFSYPNHTGCVEGCPYGLPRQSYCHVAGDGRPPDRGRLAMRIGQLIASRRKRGLADEAERERALRNLTAELEGVTEVAARGAVSEVDRNGRPPWISAAMLGDVAVLAVLWRFHNATTGFQASAVRDAGGLTALMHALQLGHTEAVAWLVGTAGAALAPPDVKILANLGVGVGGVPTGALLAAPEYLGRGGLTWAHPSGATFVNHPMSA